MSQSRSKPESGFERLYLRPVIWGVVCSVAVCVLLLLLLSGVVTLRDVPVRLIDPMMVAVLFFASFAGGYLAARMTREKGLLMGLSCSGAFFLLLLAAGLPLTGGRFTTLLPVKLFGMLLFGAVGGILGVNLRVRHK